MATSPVGPQPAGARQGADSRIYGARPEVVLGIALLPGMSLLPEQDVTFLHMAQVISLENQAICWESGD